jgi:hypothetical protein
MYERMIYLQKENIPGFLTIRFYTYFLFLRVFLCLLGVPAFSADLGSAELGLAELGSAELSSSKFRFLFSRA